MSEIQEIKKEITFLKKNLLNLVVNIESIEKKIDMLNKKKSENSSEDFFLNNNNLSSSESENNITNSIDYIFSSDENIKNDYKKIEEFNKKKLSSSEYESDSSSSMSPLLDLN